MKKAILIPLVAVILAGAAYGAKTQLDKASPTNQATDKPHQEQFSDKTSIANLIKRGQSLKCTFEKDLGEEQGKMSGTTYIANNQVRSNFELTGQADRETRKMHSIIKEDWVYTWPVMGENQGVKMKRTATKEENSNGKKEEAATGINPEEKLNYQCSRWATVDKSLFNPPEEVEFQDYSNLSNFQTEVETDTEGSPEINQESACQACSNLPNQELINQCRQQLDCE